MGHPNRKESFTNPKALLCFVSCQSLIDRYYDSIVSSMKRLHSEDYVIVVGGYSKNSFESSSRILQLESNDFYEGLPEKIVKLCRFFNESHLFATYSHLCKLDDDMVVNCLPDAQLLQHDYAGRVKAYFCNRKWHFGKCSPGSAWNQKKYEGPIVPFCLGGHGYILSRKASLLIAQDNGYKEEILEDVYVAKILRAHGVLPKKIRELKKYFISPEHTFTWF